MAKPTTLPTYATDATLTGGPQVGLSTRLSPGAGTLAQGFWQGRRLPARAFAWLVGLLCDWVAYFNGHQIKNWRLERQDFFNASTDMPAGSYLEGGVGAIWVPDAAPQKGAWYVYGCNNSAPSQQAFSMPRISSASTRGTPSLRFWGANAVNADGSILLAAGTDATSGLFAIYKSTDRGVSWGLVTTTGATPGAVVGNLGYCAASNLFLSSGATTGHILTSPDGVAWTDRGVPASTPGSGSYTAWREGGGLLAVRHFNGGFSTSSDGGLTWGAYTTLPGGLLALDFAYSAAWGWLILTTNGSIVTTGNFTAYTSLGALAIGTKAKRINCDGQRFAVSCYDTTAAPGPGILYSDNGGTTWSFVRFSASAEVDYLPWKLEFNGEQWVCVGMPSAFGSTHYGFWTTSKY
jgi:hypothetical protein